MKKMPTSASILKNAGPEFEGPTRFGLLPLLSTSTSLTLTCETDFS